MENRVSEAARRGGMRPRKPLLQLSIAFAKRGTTPHLKQAESPLLAGGIRDSQEGSVQRAPPPPLPPQILGRLLWPIMILYNQGLSSGLVAHRLMAGLT